MTHQNTTRTGAKRLVLCLAVAAAIVACAAAAWARPEGPRRIFYGTHSDSRVVVVQGAFDAPGDKVKVYYRCSSTASARGTLDVGGRVFRNLPCDDKIHLQRDVRVVPGQKHSVTLGMHSGGTAR